MLAEYLKEAAAAVSLWSRTGILEGISDPTHQQQLALLLENQRLYNGMLLKEFENRTDEELSPEQIAKRNEIGKFTRVSIPLVRRVFGPFLPLSLVGVQTILNSNGKLHYMDKVGIVRESDVSTGVKTFKTELILSEDVSLEQEAEYLGSTANSILNELIREIVIDLKLNAQSVLEHKWVGPEHLLEMVVLCSSAVDKKVGRPANWIFTSGNLSDYLTDVAVIENENKVDEDSEDPYYRGVLVGPNGKKWNLYVDPLFPSQVLMGYRGDNLNAGYFYNPYIGLAPNGQGLLARYGKKMINAGYYSRIDVRDSGAPVGGF